jgi:hypothetical protein
MMPRLMVSLAVLLLPAVAQAQYVGLSIGGMESTVDWQYPAPPASCDYCVADASPHDTRQAFSPALLAQWRAEQVVGFASELRYAPKGYATTQPTLNVGYLQVPLLLRLGRLVYPVARWSAFFELGPSVALRATCSVESSTTVESCRNGAFGADRRVGLVDLTAIGGVGAAVRIADGVLVSGARIDAGLRDIGGGADVPTKNRSTLLYIAWLPNRGAH